MPITAGQQIGIGMLQGATNMFGASKQHKRNKEMMGISHQNQQQLNRQGHQLQMDMWNKTNYGAQVAHMEKAGLNPALMYGMGGGGGTTAGSQGGGNASSGGNAVQMHPMDMANLALLKAQAEKLDAETNNIIKGTKKIGSEIEKLGAETLATMAKKLESEQNVSESKQRELNLKTENEIKEIDKNWLKEYKTSTFDHQIIRALKSTGMGMWEAMKYFLENKDELYEEFDNSINQNKNRIDG